MFIAFFNVYVYTVRLEKRYKKKKKNASQNILNLNVLLQAQDSFFYKDTL